MSPFLQPTSVEELVETVRAHAQVLAMGAGTKSRLSQTSATPVSLLKLRGITEYQPEEFIFTALAGTPVREIAETLAGKGQYLPFDPMLLDAGATIGGTVAAGISGPGRLRFGGVRDFIVGAKIVDGAGRVLRLGGKVVKNAAGFDLPKFFVGSLGRFGILAECTFKVFPRPASEITLALAVDSPEMVRRIFCEAPTSRWEPAALDLLPDGKTLCLRLGGPAASLTLLAKEILARWPGRVLPENEAANTWSDLREFRWVHPEGVLVKVVLTPNAWPALAAKLASIDSAHVHVSGAGNQVFISLPSPEGGRELDDVLKELNLSGVTLRGARPLWLGGQPRFKLHDAVKFALDPQNRFPGLDD